ncbi:cell division protein FtsH [Opitutaceae bacterium EW11]|nr:cell division protein FtsH [Opitutaceae bacterium EW11]
MPNTPQKTPPGPALRPPSRAVYWYLLVMLLALWAWQEAYQQVSVRTIPYSEFKTHVARREVTEVLISQDQIVGRIVPAAAGKGGGASGPQKDGATGAAAAKAPTEETKAANPDGGYSFRTVRVEDPELVKQLQDAGVSFTGTRPSFLSQFLFAWVLPIILMVGLWTLVARRFARAGQSVLSIGKCRAKLHVDKKTGVTFDDVAGADEAKLELKEVVEFLKRPQQFQKLGARIPKGVLLVGPPGTGKTLLARAVAGEAGVAFYSISGSDFVEMFVGVGASRVRDLFQQAQQSAPCIIFIDELDAIGRQRGVHMGAVNDEREQTLNALLVEMDGFEANVGVIVLAATNRPEVLDRALLRPGRFDRQVLVDSPDRDGREAILKVHARNKRLESGVDLGRVAAATVGFSGADLANLLNEAALLAARRSASAIGQADLEEAIEKVVAGPERKSRRLRESEKRRVAYHEVGHALVSAYSPEADAVHKISIVPRGRAALGFTMQRPHEDQFLLTRTELLDRIRGMLGGRAAEEVVFGEVSTGAQNDLERATALARQMVALYGMSDRVGLAHCVQRQPAFAGGPEFQFQRDCSEETAREIDEEVSRILADAYREALEQLRAHRDQLESITAELLKRETIDGPEFYRLVGRPMPHVKEPIPAIPEPENVPSPLGQSAAQGK